MRSRASSTLPERKHIPHIDRLLGARAADQREVAGEVPGELDDAGGAGDALFVGEQRVR